MGVQCRVFLVQGAFSAGCFSYRVFLVQGAFSAGCV
jgi:hypothetical protein